MDSIQDPHTEARLALLKILGEVEAGINEQNIERIIAQMDPGVTVTWLNGEVSRGHEEVRSYHHKMVKGPDRLITRYTSAVTLGAKARFYGNGTVAVTEGTTEDEFFPVIRGPFKLDSRWSSTAALIDGQWKIVTLHLSANVFSNTLMDEMKKALLYVGAGGALAGSVLGWLLGRGR